MKRLGVVLVVGLALLAGGARALGEDVPTTPPPDLHVCSLPGSPPYWFDYADGWVPFWKLFARPGLIGAVPGLGLPAMIRARGGTTVYFDLYLKRRVGIPSDPADPSLIDARADKFFIYVENSTHCSNPVIAENELYGAWLATPWSPTNAQYRANVLRFMQRLHELGAQPWLLVNSPPYTAGDARDWWRALGQASGIVREDYFSAPQIYGQGPVLGSRVLRQAFRQSLLDFTSIGILASKLGIFVGFQTTKGTGGREGLEPAQAWFETVKLQALAAKQVAKEMHFNGIWSWGWAEYTTTPGEVDPDKQRAACVYLWTRDPKLCNGPATAGKGFDRSRTEGQLNLPSYLRCRIGGVGVLGWGSIVPLRALTGDPDLAFSNAYARVLENDYAPLTSADLLAAEQALVATRFQGSRRAYLAAIATAKASLSVARNVIADQVRRARIEAHIGVGQPSASAISDFRQTYATTRVRLVQTSAPVAWLGGKTQGYAIASNAPPTVMRLPSNRWSDAWSATGSVRVQPLEAPVLLGSVPFERIRPSIRAALIAQAREGRYPSWIAEREARAFAKTTCWRDDFPALGEADLTDYLPFLSLAS